MTGPVLTLAAVSAELRRLGVAIRSAPGEYRVNYRGGQETTSYHTDDLADALATGRAMAENPPPPAPLPLGPVGRRNTRRAQMINHNRRLAERRRAQATREARGSGKHRMTTAVRF
jgi:hypothetical protein